VLVHREVEELVCAVSGGRWGGHILAEPAAIDSQEMDCLNELATDSPGLTCEGEAEQA
jgi:hypothetical protein